jgi:pimeloyl-ACP methyl ester carboxylesterase
MIALAKAPRAPGWWPHYRAARRTRFTGGASIAADVLVRVVFGDEDRIALAGRSRFADELPVHATVETWPGCGHLLGWDAPERVIAAALEL